MSLLSELRALCHQLSSTPSTQLPYLTPVLLRDVSRCHGPLSSGGVNPSKSDISESSVLVYKFKTQLSTLLRGKSPEGRFTAVVLIKAVVEIGGWEILRGAESWVKGLLSILEKPGGVLIKRLCILTLTKIYLMTHQYQTLIREIITPTLPIFVSSCLSLVSSKLSSRVLDVPLSLMESILEAFSFLIPRHPTIFRPFTNQIRLVTRPYLAPTTYDQRFVPSSVSKSARRVIVLTHQTAAKNSSGEELVNSIRELIKDIHGTADKVYRSVIEDWESACGYTSQQVDMNQELHGGGRSHDDLPPWNGIDAGLERLIGLVRHLEEYFENQTANSVTIPLGSVVDLLTRLMSVLPPKNSGGTSGYGEMRLRPAVERNERDRLWAGLPSVHIASMNAYAVLVDRLQLEFTPLAQSCIDQVTWAFPSGYPDETFRSTAYCLVTKILPLCGFNIPKKTVDNMTPILRACCKEFSVLEGKTGPSSPPAEGAGQRSSKTLRNTDSFLQLGAGANPHLISSKGISDVLEAATELLPLFLLYLPQQHLEAYLRAELDRTAIIYRHKEAMVASVLNSYVGKDGRSLPSILPHLCRQFPSDDTVETLLRPRLPVLRQIISTHAHGSLQEEYPDMEDDVMEDVITVLDKDEEVFNTDKWHPPHENAPASIVNAIDESKEIHVSKWEKAMPDALEQTMGGADLPTAKRNSPIPQPDVSNRIDVIQNPSCLVGEGEDSDNSSVHLTMAMSDSEESVT